MRGDQGVGTTSTLPLRWALEEGSRGDCAEGED